VKKYYFRILNNFSGCLLFSILFVLLIDYVIFILIDSKITTDVYWIRFIIAWLISGVTGIASVHAILNIANYLYDKSWLEK
jgi:hypothetical protein